MIRFYAPDILNTCALPESDSAHAVRVLRKKIGDEIEIVDGSGTIYTCRLMSENPKNASVQIVSETYCPKIWKPSLTVAVAPTKNIDRIEWMLEKLVEIGIDTFVPLLCQRSERKNVNIERLQKIAVSAMKQSLKAVLPEILPLTPFKNFIGMDFGRDAQKFVGWCDGSSTRKLLATACKPDTDTVILIGPEGDFSQEEIEICTSYGFVPITMGDNRLRTETAALTGADTFHIINQLFQEK